MLWAGNKNNFPSPLLSLLFFFGYSRAVLSGCCTYWIVFTKRACSWCNHRMGEGFEENWAHLTEQTTEQPETNSKTFFSLSLFSVMRNTNPYFWQLTHSNVLGKHIQIYTFSTRPRTWKQITHCIRVHYEFLTAQFLCIHMQYISFYNCGQVNSDGHMCFRQLQPITVKRQKQGS